MIQNFSKRTLRALVVTNTLALLLSGPLAAIGPAMAQQQPGPAPSAAIPSDLAGFEQPWPRAIVAGGLRMMVYQPQVEEWNGNRLELKAAVGINVDAPADEKARQDQANKAATDRQCADQEHAAKAASDSQRTQQDQARRANEDKARQDQTNKAAADRQRADQERAARAQADQKRQQENAAKAQVEQQRPPQPVKPQVPPGPQAQGDRRQQQAVPTAQARPLPAPPLAQTLPQVDKGQQQGSGGKGRDKKTDDQAQ